MINVTEIMKSGAENRKLPAMGEHAPCVDGE